jgi:hypothetical protein
MSSKAGLAELNSREKLQKAYEELIEDEEGDYYYEDWNTYKKIRRQIHIISRSEVWKGKFGKVPRLLFSVYLTCTSLYRFHALLMLARVKGKGVQARCFVDVHHSHNRISTSGELANASSISEARPSQKSAAGQSAFPRLIFEQIMNLYLLYTTSDQANFPKIFIVDYHFVQICILLCTTI